MSFIGNKSIAGSTKHDKLLTCCLSRLVR